MSEEGVAVTTSAPSSADESLWKSRTHASWTLVRGALAGQVIFLLLACGYVAVAAAAGLQVRPGGAVVTLLLVGVGLIVLWEVTRLRWKYRSRRRKGGPLSSPEAWRRVWIDLRGGVLSPPRLLQAAVALTVLAVFMEAFVAWKQSIPDFTVYRWDSVLADLDAALHGGIDPWRLTHFALGFPWATRIIDTIYASWYLVVWFTLIATAFAAPSPVRTRFLVTYLLAWGGLGTVLALFFASGGPVYFEHFTGSPRFQPLMEGLETMGLRATFLQAALLDAFTGRSAFPGEGIAAMPSMHIAVAALIALLAGSLDRRLGWLAWAYTAAILLGSVHLGWHYAIDGYVAIAGTVALWYGVGWVQRWQASLQPSADPPPSG